MSQVASASLGVLADEQAEQAILGVLLQRADALRENAHNLQKEDFYYDKHRHIFEAIEALDNARQSVDTVTVKAQLDRQGLSEAAGGPQYLARLRTESPLVTNLASYIDIVQDLSLRRKIVAAARETMHLANESPDDGKHIADHAANFFMSLALTRSNTSAEHIQEPLKKLLFHLEERLKKDIEGGITGVPTGFYQLDQKTNGWQKGDLIIIAARPGMGKTAFALNLLLNAAIDKRAPTAGVIFSLEMGAEQLAGRVLTSAAKIPASKLRAADLNEAQLTQIYETSHKIKDLPIYIDETPSLNIAEMARKCRQLKYNQGIGLIIVDYLQLMTGSTQNRNANREQEISDISRRLKALARELECPVIALSQLNRAVENRSDKRPMLADLRESGAIEQDADLILFLYRQIYYDRLAHKDGAQGQEDNNDTSMLPSRDGDDAEVIIAKHRNGATGTSVLTFHETYTLFTNRVGDRPPDLDDADLIGPPTSGFDPDMDFQPARSPSYSTPEPFPEDEDDLPI